MSDFMMSQVQGLLGKVADDIDKLDKSTTAQTEMLLGAINDMAANMVRDPGAVVCSVARPPRQSGSC